MWLVVLFKWMLSVVIIIGLNVAKVEGVHVTIEKEFKALLEFCSWVRKSL